MRTPGKAGSEAMPRNPTVSLSSTAAACVLSPTENSRTEITTEKDRSGRGIHLDMFDKLRRKDFLRDEDG